MTTEREKPTGDGATDDAVEILADASASTRRRASRKLRVPSDQVPRRPTGEHVAAIEPEAEEKLDESAVTADDAVEEPGPVTIPDAVPVTPPKPIPSRPPLPLPRPSIPAVAAADASSDEDDEADEAEAVADHDAEPVSDSDVLPSDLTEPVPIVRDEPPARTASVPPPKSAAAVVPKSAAPVAPKPPVAPPAAATQARAPSVPPPRPPAAEAATTQAEPASRPAMPPPSGPPSTSTPPTGVAGPDLGVVVRTVRRKIKSVGTGEAPEFTARPVQGTSDRPPSLTTLGSVDVDVPIPAAAPSVAGEDDFDVPPVDTAPTDVAELDSAVVDLDDANAEEPVEAIVDEPTEEIVVPEEIRNADRAKQRATVPEPPSGKRPPAPPPRAQRAAEPSASAGKREESAPSKKKRRPWWEELFNDEYFRTMPKCTPTQTAAQGDFIENSLGAEKGAVVLDLACGDGRQAIELAVRGYEVIALDLSLAMLSRASDAAQDRNAKLNFLHSDMREMEFNQMFDAAYCMNTSFGYFEDEKNIDVINRLYRALKEGGTLLLDVANRDYVIQSQPSMAWYEGDGCVCMEETAFNFITSRLTVKRTMILDDGRQKEVEASIRMYSLHELGQLLHNAGFRVLEVSGHERTPGAFFGPASRQLIILAQKQKRPVSEPAISIAATTTAAATNSAVPPAPPTVPIMPALTLPTSPAPATPEPSPGSGGNGDGSPKGGASS